jgi:hypothetical protein
MSRVFYMFKNLKSFNTYSLIVAIMLYIFAGISILGGIGYLAFGFIAAFGISGKSGMFAALLYLLLMIVVSAIYIGLSVFMIYQANHYLKRSGEAQKLDMLDPSDASGQLTILKEIERREFWIERILYYPSLYLSAIIMCITIVFAPLGIITLLGLESQRKMDLLKNKFNFNSDVLPVEDRRDNSKQIFEYIQSKTKWEAWAYILGVLSLILFIVLMVAVMSLVAFNIQNNSMMMPMDEYRVR